MLLLFFLDSVRLYSSHLFQFDLYKLCVNLHQKQAALELIPLVHDASVCLHQSFVNFSHVAHLLLMQIYTELI